MGALGEFGFDLSNLLIVLPGMAGVLDGRVLGLCSKLVRLV